MKPLSRKPSDLLPSDESVKSGDKVVQQSQPVHPPKSDQQVGTANVAAPATAPGGDGGAGQVVIRYADGREETIDVVNLQSVRQVAKAGQVIPTPGGGLSVSLSQTSQPHQMSNLVYLQCCSLVQMMVQMLLINQKPLKVRRKMMHVPSCLVLLRSLKMMINLRRRRKHTSLVKDINHAVRQPLLSREQRPQNQNPQDCTQYKC